MTERVECVVIGAGVIGLAVARALMLAYQGDTENAGGAVVFHAPVLGGAVQQGGGFLLRIGGAEPMELECEILVNAVGLQAPDIARRIDGIPPESIPPKYLCKGSY